MSPDLETPHGFVPAALRPSHGRQRSGLRDVLRPVITRCPGTVRILTLRLHLTHLILQPRADCVLLLEDGREMQVFGKLVDLKGGAVPPGRRVHGDRRRLLDAPILIGDPLRALGVVCHRRNHVRAIEQSHFDDGCREDRFLQMSGHQSVALPVLRSIGLLVRRRLELAPLEPDSTLIAVIEMSLSSWLVAGIVPGVERQPLKKLAVDESVLLKLLHRWREEAEKAGYMIKRIAVAFEAGRDGFWLARWLMARDIEVHVIHTSSVAISREHRRAKTDRLDTELLKRAFLGWLRGERDHCKMVAIPTIIDEDGKRPNRERESLVGEQSRIINRIKATLVRLGIRSFNPKLKKAAERLEGLRTPEGEPIPPNTLSELYRDMERRRLVRDQIRQIESARLDRLEHAPGEGAHAMVRLLARVMGIGIETADMLVQEVLSRNLRDRRAVARYAGLTARPTRAGRSAARKGWRDPGILGFGMA